MIIYRIRIIEVGGQVHVIDKTHSQLCRYLDVGREVFRKFLSKEPVTLPNGDDVKLVGYV